MNASKAPLEHAVEQLIHPAADVTEADIQSTIHMVLTLGRLGLENDDVVKLESPAGDGSLRRLDIELGFTIIEVKKRLEQVTDKQRSQLAGYLELRTEQTGATYAGILTDGRRWKLYRLDELGETLVEVAEFIADPDDPHVAERLVNWLETVMATRQTVPPTPAEIMARLGADSAGFLFELGQIRDLYARVADDSEIRLKRSLWAKSLESAFGTQFDNTDELFCSHTYLVIVAELVAHSAIGFDTATLDPADLLAGTEFVKAGVRGVVEADFFDWIVHPPPQKEIPALAGGSSGHSPAGSLVSTGTRSTTMF